MMLLEGTKLEMIQLMIENVFIKFWDWIGSFGTIWRKKNYNNLEERNFNFALKLLKDS